MTDKNDNEVEEFVPESFDIDEAGTSLAKQDESSKNLALGTQAAHESLMIRAKGLEALRKATIKSLTEDDFHLFGGTSSWLQSSGVNKISAVYGIDFTEPVFSAPEWGDLPGLN